jgi:transcriptional regulator with XRE-family HTH domain
MTHSEAEALGAVVRRLREQCGYSQEDLARLGGTTRTTIQNLENGRRMTRGKTLRLIAGAFDLDLATLRGLAGIGEQPAEAELSPAVRAAIARSGLSDREVLAALRAARETRAAG